MERSQTHQQLKHIHHYTQAWSSQKGEGERLKRMEGARRVSCSKRQPSSNPNKTSASRVRSKVKVKQCQEAQYSVNSQSETNNSDQLGQQGRGCNITATMPFSAPQTSLDIVQMNWRPPGVATICAQCLRLTNIVVYLEIASPQTTLISSKVFARTLIATPWMMTTTLLIVFEGLIIGLFSGLTTMPPLTSSTCTYTLYGLQVSPVVARNLIAVRVGL